MRKHCLQVGKRRRCTSTSEPVSKTLKPQACMVVIIVKREKKNKKKTKQSAVIFEENKAVPLINQGNHGKHTFQPLKIWA